MAELHCDLREEQRVYCKIHGLFHKYPLEIKKTYILVYGENALRSILYKTTIARWVSMLKDGKTNVKDDPHPGWPISTSSEKEISTVKSIVDEDARYTMEKISDI
jgi:hypothetical protein